MRHAQVAYFDVSSRRLRGNAVPLTPEGRRQARAAAVVLAGVSFDRVITSDTSRAQETARLVTGREPEVWKELNEIRGGRLADIPDDEVEAAFKGAFRGPIRDDARFLNGETIGNFLDRVLPALARLQADQSWDTLLAVLHGAVNRAILSLALTGTRTFLGGFEQAPACINIIDLGANDWVVRLVNHSPYDPLHHGGSRMTAMEELHQEYVSYRQAILPND